MTIEDVLKLGEKKSLSLCFDLLTHTYLLLYKKQGEIYDEVGDFSSGHAILLVGYELDEATKTGEKFLGPDLVRWWVR